MDKPILCYVRGAWAYFTTQPLEDQWGDDWDDAPYEHNAGSPYEFSESDGKWCVCRDPTGPKIYGKGGCGEPGHKPREPKPRYEITQVAFDAPYETPAELACGGNSRYSVQDINDKHVPWLTPSRWGLEVGEAKPIFAGATKDEFIRLIQKSGGKVYLEAEVAK